MGAVNTGNNLMYLLVSALLGFMAVSGLLGRGNLTGVTLSVEPPEEIYAGVETLLTIRLHNRRRFLPVCLLRLELPVGDAAATLLRPGEKSRLPLAATFRDRGVHRLEALRLSSAFPINFFVRSLVLPLRQEVAVFPAPRPCALPAGGRLQPLRGELATGKGYEGELTRIGDYRGGEPLKLIHWKLSARHGELKVKELSALATPPLLVDPARLPGAGLEERLGCACWLITAAARQGRPVGLRLAGKTLPPAVGRQHKLHLLNELARYGRDPRTP
ncbi:MAG TPA: DUF58 domain-containing protein [Gammaproteobacteria bacterium]|nr:DUF58 domain-containing protein [Gammaproteobacteria bacterium]